MDLKTDKSPERQIRGCGWADKSQSWSDFCVLCSDTQKFRVVWCRGFALGKLRVEIAEDEINDCGDVAAQNLPGQL